VKNQISSNLFKKVNIQTACRKPETRKKICFIDGRTCKYPLLSRYNKNVKQQCDILFFLVIGIKGLLEKHISQQ
jgi:hypothetical protein